MDNTKALSTVRTGEVIVADYFPLIREQGQQDMRALYDQGLLRGLNPNELSRVKIGAGGSLNFNYSTTEGDQTAKIMSGIIMAERTARLLWPPPGSNVRKGSPPLCSSKDGFWGVGDPGGDCTQCPWAEYGTDPKGGRGQACKQIHQILFLREGQFLPDILSVPPTSLKNCRQYFLRLLSSGTAPWTRVTTLTLERATNAGGDEYAKINFTAGPVLSDGEKALMRPYASAMANFLRPINLTTEDYEVQEEQSPEQPDTAPEA
jgi:hypothetical protein